MITEKTKTQLLKEAQQIVDDINKLKEDVEKTLIIIDGLEIKYYEIIKEIKEKK